METPSAGTFAATGRWFSKEETVSRLMQQNHLNNKDHSMWKLDRPVVVVIAIAVFSVLALLIVDHGPWSRPRVETAEVANYRTTGKAARAVGAAVTPTAPKPALEPVPPGPKPVAPANPATR